MANKVRDQRCTQEPQGNQGNNSQDDDRAASARAEEAQQLHLGLPLHPADATRVARTAHRRAARVYLTRCHRVELQYWLAVSRVPCHGGCCGGSEILHKRRQ